MPIISLLCAIKKESFIDIDKIPHEILIQLRFSEFCKGHPMKVRRQLKVRQRKERQAVIWVYI